MSRSVKYVTIIMYWTTTGAFGLLLSFTIYMKCSNSGQAILPRYFPTFHVPQFSSFLPWVI